MDYLNINKKLWDERVGIHYDSEFYDLKSFLKGKDSLNPIEIELLGDIKGKHILHLQCHFGQDTISLARRGAIVTGVDFSEKAIAKAKELNETLGTNAQFLVSDVYNLPENLTQKFDIVFTSYGVLGWLPDMKKWASVIEHFLKPNGELILVEFHPIVWMFNEHFSKIDYGYNDAQPIVEESQGTYTNPKADIKTKSVSWNHGLSSVIQPLIEKDLYITHFAEHNASPYNCFNHTVQTGDNEFKIKGLEDKIPMLYSVKAMKYF